MVEIENAKNERNAVTFFVTLLRNFLSKNYQVLSMFNINFFQSILVFSVSRIMRQTGNCIEIHKLSLAKKAKSKYGTLKRIEFYIKLYFFQQFFKRNSSLKSWKYEFKAHFFHANARIQKRKDVKFVTSEKKQHSIVDSAYFI